MENLTNYSFGYELKGEIMKIKTTLIALVALFVSSLSLAAPVNINTASATEIADALNGVGMVKAEALSLIVLRKVCSVAPSKSLM